MFRRLERLKFQNLETVTDVERVLGRIKSLVRSVYPGWITAPENVGHGSGTREESKDYIELQESHIVVTEYARRIIFKAGDITRGAAT
jgi:hypothetical protein